MRLLGEQRKTRTDKLNNTEPKHHTIPLTPLRLNVKQHYLNNEARHMNAYKTYLTWGQGHI